MREVNDRDGERNRSQGMGEKAVGRKKELKNRHRPCLAQKERLATRVQASAEFVHDIGNPLTIVWGYVQLLAKKLEDSETNSDSPKPPGSNKELEIIEQNVRLCRDLLTMWQSYGSGEAAPHRIISISEIVREVVRGAEGMTTERPVKVESEITDDPCNLMGEAVQVTRAIQNVMITAMQAS